MRDSLGEFCEILTGRRSYVAGLQRIFLGKTCCMVSEALCMQRSNVLRYLSQALAFTAQVAGCS